MSASVVGRESHRTRVPALLVMVVAAFAVGALMGVGVQGALDRAGASTTKPPAFQGVAHNNMSDAANAAVHGRRTTVVRFQGVADNNMSDAANSAVHGRRTGPFKGVADNNMSDAARRAIYSSAR